MCDVSAAHVLAALLRRPLDAAGEPVDREEQQRQHRKRDERKQRVEQQHED